MTKTLHLTKVTIRNFRSIKVAHINNIGDIAVFVGANESGKSNILKALNWFGTDKPLGGDDIPVEFLGKENKEYSKKPIIEAYFEIVNKDKFKEKIISNIKEILEVIKVDINEDILINFEDMLNKIQFLKFEKYADGLFKTYIYDDQLEDITKEFYDCFKNVISKKTPLDLFNLIYEEVLKEEVKKQNIPENQISNAVANIRGNPNFNNHYRKILDEIRTLNTFEEFYEICKRIENIVKSIPNTSVSISIPGRNIQLNPYNIFTEILTKFNSIVTIAFINLKPKFVYLDEEMELKGAVIKNTSWSNTLKEENKTTLLMPDFLE
ncbi:AAA family ATPase [Methanocaldococcus jannaschii]|nr:AAA family ATPase [Methanocaldococcus jannaschii]